MYSFKFLIVLKLKMKQENNVFFLITIFSVVISNNHYINRR